MRGQGLCDLGIIISITDVLVALVIIYAWVTTLLDGRFSAAVWVLGFRPLVVIDANRSTARAR